MGEDIILRAILWSRSNLIPARPSQCLRRFSWQIIVRDGGRRRQPHYGAILNKVGPAAAAAAAVARNSCGKALANRWQAESYQLAGGARSQRLIFVFGYQTEKEQLPLGEPTWLPMVFTNWSCITAYRIPRQQLWLRKRSECDGDRSLVASMKCFSLYIFNQGKASQKIAAII